MSDYLNSLQQAIYTRLSADAALTLLVGNRILDHVPKEAICPYITLAEYEQRDASVKGLTLLNIALTLHVWSREAGQKEVQRILSVLRDNLHDASLTLSEGAIARVQEESVALRRSGDGRLRQGIARYRVMLSSS